MKTRLQYIVNNEGLSNNKFAAEIGISPAAVTHIISGRNNPSLDIIAKIASRYPQYRLRWLVLGELPILSADETATVTNTVEILASENGAPVRIEGSNTTAPEPQQQALEFTEQSLPFGPVSGSSSSLAHKVANEAAEAEQIDAKETSATSPRIDFGSTNQQPAGEQSRDRLIVCLPDGTFQEYVRR